MKLVFAVLTVFHVALACCAAIAGADLADTDWLLDALPTEAGVKVEPVPLAIGKNRYSTRNACNSLFGDYEHKGLLLSFKNFGETRKFCVDDTDRKTGGVYLSALKQVRSYAFENGKLMLKNEAGETVAIFVAQPTDLEGTSWNVSGFAMGDGGVEYSEFTQRLKMSFLVDGKLTGFAGCQSYTGQYQSDGDKLSASLSRLKPSGASSCKQSSNDLRQQKEFFRSLKRVVAYRRVGNSLYLQDAKGWNVVDLGLMK